MGNVFKTSENNKIKFINGYRAAHRPAGDPLHGAEKNISSENMDFRQFLKDVYQYSLMMDFLRPLDLDFPVGTALDIGGAEGTISRLLTAEGHVTRADCIDVENRKSKLTQSLFSRYIKFLLAGNRAGRYLPSVRSRLIRENELRFGYVPHEGSIFHNISLAHPPELHEYIVGDAIERKFDTQYDLVTAHLCLEYFKPDAIFERVYDLLTPGGVFFFLVNYWWFPVNSTRVVGDFPYAAQRLSRSDLVRYLKNYYPNEYKDAMERYDYYHQGQHPVLSDYVDIGTETGFSLLNYMRFIPRGLTHPKTPIPPTVIPNEYLREVLVEAQNQNPSVRNEDLKTAFICCAFKKPDGEREVNSITDHITQISRDGYGVYRHSGSRKDWKGVAD